MLEEGHFYPYKTMSAEERLWWYSRFFDTVEVNSTFYALPSADTTALWVARTQPGFMFNVKAYGLLTGHHLDAARLPERQRSCCPPPCAQRNVAVFRALRSARIRAHGRSPSCARGWRH